jgi:alkylation response protein AidB-like acyl-CoA dehydrogenase
MSLFEDQGSQLAAGLREFLAQDSVGTAPDDPGRWWRALADFGLFALAVPEEHGGLGLGAVESASAFEALGQALAWGPLIWAQLAALAIPELASGKEIVTGVDLIGQPEGDPLLVEHLVAADRLLVLSGDGVRLYGMGELDFTELALPLDPLTPIAQLDRIHGGELVADTAAAARLRRTGTLLSAAFLLGISDAALRIATDYAKERCQFGRPIGGFQAIKHLLADCYVRTSLARAALYAAAEFMGSDLSAAKLLCGRAADANARTAVQVFGGMGFTWETAPHFLLKRAWILDSAFGSAEEHALALGEELALGSEAVA